VVRPSRNVDQLLIQAGHELLVQTGVRGLSIRQLTEHAGVNLGMFHYHFKTKDVFVRALLEQKYNDMFVNLQMKSKGNASALENLRASINVLARFARDNRLLLVRLLADAAAGESVALDFLRANMPRHLHVEIDLIKQAQKDGVLKTLPIPQALAFLVGAVGAPIMVGTAISQTSFSHAPVRKQLEQFVFTDAAIAERVDMALAGMAAPKKSGGRK
jgi:AcrR family transcriptional regulator